MFAKNYSAQMCEDLWPTKTDSFVGQVFKCNLRRMQLLRDTARSFRVKQEVPNTKMQTRDIYTKIQNQQYYQKVQTKCQKDSIFKNEFHKVITKDKSKVQKSFKSSKVWRTTNNISKKNYNQYVEIQKLPFSLQNAFIFIYFILYVLFVLQNKEGRSSQKWIKKYFSFASSLPRTRRPCWDAGGDLFHL